MRIAVTGAGAMGSIHAALMADAGNDVIAADAWATHVAAINQHGLRVEGASGDRTVRLLATTDPTSVGAVDLMIVALVAASFPPVAVLALIESLGFSGWRGYVARRAPSATRTPGS